jgi:hypothetical protein
MVQLDEGVGNLERFIGIITDTSAKLDEGVEALDDAASHIDGVEGDTEDTLGDFVSTLEDMAGDIGDAAGTAAESIDRVAQQAREIAQDRCGEVESDATAAGDSFEERIESGGDALDTETASTVNDGFKVFGETLDRSTQELKQAGEEAGQALKTLGTDAASEQAEAEQAFDGMESSLDAAGSEITTHASTIEAASQAAVSDLEGAGEDLEAECTDQQGEADATYQTFGDTVEEKAGDLATETQTLLESAGDDLNTEASEPITAALGLAVDEAGNEYDAALDDVGTALTAGEEMSNELEPLVGELDKAEGIVDEIDRLLKAME